MKKVVEPEEKISEAYAREIKAKWIKKSKSKKDSSEIKRTDNSEKNR